MYFYGILNYEAMLVQQNLYSQWFDTQHAYQSIPLPQIQEKEKLESVQAVKVQNINGQFQNQQRTPSKEKLKTKKMICRPQKKQKRKVMKKDKNFSVRIQKQGRNVCSNTLRYFIKFIEGHSTNPKRIEKIIQIHNIHTTSNEFLKSLGKYVVHAKHYIRLTLISDIFRGFGWYFQECSLNNNLHYFFIDVQNQRENQSQHQLIVQEIYKATSLLIILKFDQ